MNPRQAPRKASAVDKPLIGVDFAPVALASFGNHSGTRESNPATSTEPQLGPCCRSTPTKDPI